MKKSDKNSKATSNTNGKKKEYNSSVTDWLNDDVSGEYSSATLSNKRRYAPMRQSSSVGHLVTLGRISNHAQSEKDLNLASSSSPYDKKIKRTKSLWKFKKVDDVLEGMSMWKHRSLVDINANAVAAEGNFSRGTPVLDKRMTVTREISVDSGDENSTLMNGTQGKSKGNKIFESGARRSLMTRTADSDESDQESCIVVNDHRKTDSISVASKLPRTRLSKTNSTSSMKLENGYNDYSKDSESDAVFESNKLQMFKCNRIADSAWYDSWGERRKK